MSFNQRYKNSANTQPNNKTTKLAKLKNKEKRNLKTQLHYKLNFSQLRPRIDNSNNQNEECDVSNLLSNFKHDLTVNEFVVLILQ